MTDPDTPFLHVGMNAPRAEREGGWIQRSWGVGVQNMAREYLPRSALRRTSGDGLLRLQVRSQTIRNLGTLRTGRPCEWPCCMARTRGC